MLTNAGKWDRALRALLGIGLLFFLPTPWNWLGIVPLLTAALGYCPLYHVLGFSTCRTPAPHG